MSLRVYLPGDTTAVALGADEVAAALLEQAGFRDLPIWRPIPTS